jgi:hypothetical protein
LINVPDLLNVRFFFWVASSSTACFPQLDRMAACSLIVTLFRTERHMFHEQGLFLPDARQIGPNCRNLTIDMCQHFIRHDETAGQTLLF